MCLFETVNYSHVWITQSQTLHSPWTQLQMQKKKESSKLVAGACSPSQSGACGQRIAGVQEFKAGVSYDHTCKQPLHFSLGDTVKPCL